MARRELSSAQMAVVQAVRSGLPEDASRIVRVRVACSGGADSLALAVGLAWLDTHESDPLRASSALVVDHGLQPGSATVAAGVVDVLQGLGLEASSVRVDVAADDPDGLEAAARKARFEVLTRGDVDVVLLGHTMDDQAETVLLGLARGSGIRSLAGMPSSWQMAPGSFSDGLAPLAKPAEGANSSLSEGDDHLARISGLDDSVRFVRPLLGLRRATTRQACADWGLTPWDDPMNDDLHFARVRARQLLPVMEDALGPGLVEALARTAALARADADYLDGQASAMVSTASTRELPVEVVAAAPDALQGRIVRQWLAGLGVTELSYERTQAVLALVTDWRGQGSVDLPGGVRVARRDGALFLVQVHR